MEKNAIIGCDLGGTKSAVARYDQKTFELLASERFPTRAMQGFSVVLDEVLSVIQRLRTADTEAVGIGIPGFLRKEDGVIFSLPNIPGGEGFPLQKTLQERLGLRVTVSNDAQCFAFAEAQKGAGRGKHLCIGITMGTGVGGGIVVAGKLFQGNDGCAGEIGHMLLVPGQPPYPTEDMRGDVEQFLSGTAFGRRCEVAERPEDYLEGTVCAFMQPDVFREIAWLCANLSALLNPSIIIFGGSAGRALKPHLRAIENELAKWLLPKTPLPELAIAEREDAATLGAALLAVSGE